MLELVLLLLLGLELKFHEFVAEFWVLGIAILFLTRPNLIGESVCPFSVNTDSTLASPEAWQFSLMRR